MKKIEVMDYLKASKEPTASLDCFVRFKIDRLKDGRLLLVRNKMEQNAEFGAISSSLILDKKGRPIVTEEKGTRFASFDDIEQMLNHCYISLDAFETEWDEFMQSEKGGIDLGGSLLEYSKTVGYEEGVNAGMPAMSISYLQSHESHRKMGLAKRMIADVEKLAWFQDYQLLCGIGIPLEKGFCVYNKNMREMGFYFDYEKTSKRNGYSSFDPLGGVVDLAIFYSRLGFDIYPMGESFVIEKKIETLKSSKNDKMFLGTEESKLDQDIIAFEK